MTHPWARAGSHRFPGDPSHAFALLQDPGRAGKISPWRSCRCCPRSTQTEGLSGYIISRLTQGFSIRCLRFTSDVAVSHARLASGWRAAPLPGGGRTLWITSKGFRLHLHSPFQDFSCRKVVYVNTWSGVYYYNARPHPAGFCGLCKTPRAMDGPTRSYALAPLRPTATRAGPASRSTRVTSMPRAMIASCVMRCRRTGSR